MESIKVCFYLKKSKKSKIQNGRIPIYAKLRLNGKMVSFSTQIYVWEERWRDSKHFNIILKNNEDKLIRKRLDAIRFNLDEKYYQLERVNKNVTVQEVKSEITENGGKVVQFLVIFQKYLDEYAKKVNVNLRSKGTLTKYRTLYKHVENYIFDKYKKSDVGFNELHYEFMDGFQTYMRNYCDNNTTIKYLQALKSVAKYCVNHKLINDDPFKTFKLNRFHEVTSTVLTENEIQILMNQHFDSEALNKVRDIFLFTVFSGLSPIDIRQLSINQVFKKDEGYWIKSKRQKTSVPLQFKLIKPASNIVEKYLHYPNKKNPNLIFLPISNQKFNHYLKVIAEHCKIKKRLYWMVGRHTFATTIALSNGVPIEVVSQLLGHTNIKQTQHYARVTEQLVATKIDLLDTILKGKLNM